MLGRFFSGKSTASLDSVTFDASRYQLKGDTNGCRVWYTPDGDGLGLYLYLKPPNLPRRVGSLAELRDFYRSLDARQQLRVVEVDWIQVDGVRGIWLLVKMPQAPHGMAYVGSITIPFAAFSFVLKMQCEERGPTGAREAVLLDQALREGRVSFNPDGGIAGDWNPDDPACDSHFPLHPVSRARREFASICPTLRIDERTRKQAPFFEKA